MQKKQKDQSIIGTGIVSAFVLIIITCLIWAEYKTLPALSDLRFGVFSIISMIATLATAAIVIRIMTGKSRSEETSWFLLVLFGQLLFAGGETFQRASLDPAAAVFWTLISGAGASVAGIGLVLFAVAYTQPVRLRAGQIAPVLMCAALVLVTFYAGTNLVYINDPNQVSIYPWGYNTEPGVAFAVWVAWILLPGLIAGWLFLRFWYRSQNPLLRKQSMLFALAVLTPVMTAAITDMLQPLFHIELIPPLATVSLLVACILIYTGLKRYQFFRLNPAVVAENILTTMNEAVIVAKADFGIEYVNEEAKRLLGLDEDHSKLFMPSLFTVKSWEKVTETLEGKAALVQAERLDDIMVVSTDGRHIPVRARVSNVYEGDFLAHVFVITDISDIVETYHELESKADRIRELLKESRDLQQQLQVEKSSVERVVEIRTRELRLAQEELKESDKLKTEFIMLGAHNLRTPITIMANSLELFSDADEEQRKELLVSLSQGVNRMKDFVEDMVTIADLEAGSGLKHEAISISELLKPLISDAEGLASTRDALQFTSEIAEDSTIIMANSVRLRAALSNLIDNAFKFTSQGAIRLNGALTANGYEISVTDSGIGIAAEEMPRIFEKFHRATDTLQYEYDGKGIGLYLSRLIIVEHGGTLKAASELGTGSTFTAALPVVER